MTGTLRTPHHALQWPQQMKTKTVISFLLILVLSAGVWAAQKHHSDDELYDLVRRKLADDQVVKGGALQVDVKDDVVT